MGPGRNLASQGSWHRNSQTENWAGMHANWHDSMNSVGTFTRFLSDANLQSFQWNLCWTVHHFANQDFSWCAHQLSAPLVSLCTPTKIPFMSIVSRLFNTTSRYQCKGPYYTVVVSKTIRRALELLFNSYCTRRLLLVTINASSIWTNCRDTG